MTGMLSQARQGTSGYMVSPGVWVVRGGGSHLQRSAL